MITITGIVELMDSDHQEGLVDVMHKFNWHWDEHLKQAKSVHEFYFEYDAVKDHFDFVGCKQITKAKARKNKQ